MIMFRLTHWFSLGLTQPMNHLADLAGNLYRAWSLSIDSLKHYLESGRLSFSLCSYPAPCPSVNSSRPRPWTNYQSRKNGHQISLWRRDSPLVPYLDDGPTATGRAAYPAVGCCWLTWIGLQCPGDDNCERNFNLAFTYFLPHRSSWRPIQGIELEGNGPINLRRKRGHVQKANTLNIFYMGHCIFLPRHCQDSLIRIR